MGDHRYFPLTVMFGTLYRDGAALTYCNEAIVDILVERGGHRKARTEVELIAVVRESERGLPAIRMWAHDSLEALARRIWEKNAKKARED